MGATIDLNVNPLDPRTAPSVTEARQAVSKVRAERDSIAQRQQQLWEDRHGDDKLAAAVANRDLGGVEAELLVANTTVKLAEAAVETALKAARAAAVAEWRSRQVPILEDFCDVLVLLASVVRRLNALRSNAEAVGVGVANYSHPQFSKLVVSERIGTICREAGLDASRWLPLA
jgi:hypothetical protein